jgi:hypothetical protein
MPEARIAYGGWSCTECGRIVDAVNHKGRCFSCPAPEPTEGELIAERAREAVRLEREAKVSANRTGPFSD